MEIGDDTYYMNEDETQVHTGWLDLEGERYYFDDSGKMCIGSQYIDGEWYFFRDSGTRVEVRWEWLNNTWKYFDHDGKSVQNFWIDKKTEYPYQRYLSQAGPFTGYALGWQTHNGFTYYLRPNSKTMVRGFQYIDGDWYYFRKSGTLATGHQKIGQLWYFFEDDGKMYTGYKMVDGKEYYYAERA